MDNSKVPHFYGPLCMYNVLVIFPVQVELIAQAIILCRGVFISVKRTRFRF